MAVIDTQNGNFPIGKIVFAPERTPEDFEKVYGKGSFQSRWKERYMGIEEFFLNSPVRIGTELYYFSLFFRYGKLISVHFHVEAEGTAKTLSEEATYDYYRQWLDREIGESRKFDWGHCDIRFDPKSQYGYIEVKYGTA